MPPTLSLLTLVGILALTGLTLLLWIIGGAFRDEPTRGALALVVPGYVFWYGWTRFSHAQRRAIVIAAIACLLAAALGTLYASTFGYDDAAMLAR